MNRTKVFYLLAEFLIPALLAPSFVSSFVIFVHALLRNDELQHHNDYRIFKHVRKCEKRSLEVDLTECMHFLCCFKFFSYTRHAVGLQK